MTRDNDRSSKTLDREPRAEDADRDTKPRPDRLLHFRVVARLGAGGMGVVLKAFDEKIRRHVALKVLAERYLADERNTRMLFREARAAAAISHPSITAVYEVHDESTPPFLVMELVEGITLRERLERSGRLDVAEVLRIARRAADALAAAHAAGVIHRDLKPDNVMLTPSGEVKLLDFGLAKVVGPLDVDLGFGSTTSLEPSHDGRLVGTPAYMAPEQALGREIDARTDVFAFGVVLYEALTGVRPFQRERVMETVVAVSRDAATPVASLRSSMPPALAALVDRCLEKDPARRFADGAALVRALAAIDGSTAPAPRRTRIALAGGATLAAVVAWSAWPAPKPAVAPVVADEAPSARVAAAPPPETFAPAPPETSAPAAVATPEPRPSARPPARPAPRAPAVSLRDAAPPAVASAPPPPRDPLSDPH